MGGDPGRGDGGEEGEKTVEGGGEKTGMRRGGAASVISASAPIARLLSSRGQPAVPARLPTRQTVIGHHISLRRAVPIADDPG